ncbi:MAG: PAS domain S-box protein [Spirochaetales bacterium]|nr:PAS domain S-box protein [Spirochaetales bacterium]
MDDFTDKSFTAFQPFFDHLSDIVLFHDDSFTIRWMNESAGEYFCLSPTETKGKLCYTVLMHKEKPCTGCPMRTSIAAGKPEKAEFPGIDGRMITVTGIPYGDERFSGALMLIHNKTDEKDEISFLHKREKMFRQLFENLNEVLFLRSNDRFVYISPSFEKIWGIPRETLYSDPSVLFGSMHPEDRARIASYYNMNVFRSYKMIDEQYRIIRPDGELRWISAKSLPIKDDTGKSVSRAGICEDITARKLMEAEFKLREKYLENIFNQMPYPIDIMDSSGTIIMVNKAFLEVYNIPSPDDIVGKFNLFSEPVAKSSGILAYIEEALHGRTVFIPEMKVPVSHINKEYGLDIRTNLIFEWTIFPLYLNNDKPIGIVIIRRDVSEVVGNREELERKNIALKEVLAQIELDKKEIHEQVNLNVEQLLIPAIDRFIGKVSDNDELRKAALSIKESCRQICSPFARNLKGRLMKLSPREIELCNLIKNGLTNKEIARVLNLSVLTIEKHRYRIRKKLNIVNKEINLYTYLSNL